MGNIDKGAKFLDEWAAQRPTTVTLLDLADGLKRVYREGWGRGDSTGWPALDRYYTVALGQVTTITGYPNSGKSQWMDALALNLAPQGWRFTVCSLENLPVELHAEKLIKQFVGKPVREGLNPRMSEDEMMEAAAEMDEWFTFVQPAEKKPNPSLLDVVEVIEGSFKERELWGKKDAKLAAIIDPWNELEHFRPQGVSLTEYVGESLSMLRQWVRKTMLHVFIVAHPAKQYRSRETGKLPVATPDMISDSAHFWNKSDNCLTVALQDIESPLVDVHVTKCRFAHIGRRGVETLEYDKVSGRYREPPLSAPPHYTERD